MAAKKRAKKTAKRKPSAKRKPATKSKPAAKSKSPKKRAAEPESLFERRLKPRVDLRLAFGSIAEVDSQAIVLGLFEGIQELSQAARAIDERMDGAISEISLRRMFLGKVGEIFILPAVRHDIRADLVVCAGMGAFDTFEPAVLQIVAENVARTLVRAKVTDFATVLFGASRGDLDVGLGNLVDGFFRGVRGSRARSPLRSITVCETNRLRCQGIEDGIVKLYGSARSEHVDVTLEKITLPDPPARAAAGPPSVVLQTTLVSRAEDGDTEIRFSVLGTGAKATVLSETSTIGTARLERLVAEVDEQAFIRSARPLDALKSYGKKLAKAVVPPSIAASLERVVGDNRIVWIQDSGTSRVPWETLCIGSWFPAAEAGMSRQYVADHMPVARWLEQRRYDEVIDVLLIVNPTEDLHGAEYEGRVVREAVKGLSGIEIHELRGRAATKAKVKKALLSGKYDVLHYAGHTAFFPDNPMYTGIVCARAEILSGNELAKIQNLPAVVFFNSCQSARVGGMAETEAAGLARNVGLAEAFLRGGVANYVGTHWVVSDAAAPSFMRAFYGALVDSEPMGVAVSAGRRAVRELGSRDWADYIHYGSPGFVLKVPHGETRR